MRPLRLFWFVAPFSLLAVPGLPARAQGTRSAAAAFREARNLYYTPADQGLLGFQCDVTFDWKQFIEKATSAPVQDTDERLRYLQSIKLSVSDDLNGTGSLDWVAPTTAPDASEASVTQIRTGLQALWSGFFQSWNGFFSGDLFSLQGNTGVERTTGGYHVFTRQNRGTAEEQYSADFLLGSLHVATPEIDSVLTPHFERTPQGRLITGMNSVVRRPPSAPGTSVNTTARYAPVEGFQLPSELVISVAGTTSFHFRLSQCTVRKKATAASGATGSQP